MKNKLFDTKKWYILRANNAGVFLCKIKSFDSNVAQVHSLRRLYYWNGALDVSYMAKKGVKNSGNKFSVQMTEMDLSVITNVIEFHEASEVCVNSINSVAVWNG